MKKEIENLLDEAAGQVRERPGDTDQLDESSTRSWQEIERKSG